jgi:hypothetical protein
MPRQNSLKRGGAKTILRLPDLEQSKNAVLHSLAATSSQESYGRAIDEFIGWYCSEPRSDRQLVDCPSVQDLAWRITVRQSPRQA